MSDLQLSELDYVYKKTVANAVKTDSLSTAITANAETIPTAFINSAGNVWSQANILSQGPTAAVAQGVAVKKTYIKMTSVHGVGTSQDYGNLAGVAWASGITGWVGPEYGFDYNPQFLVGSYVGTPPNSGGPFNTIVNSLSYPFTFDYKSGVLTFLNGVPISPDNLSSVAFSGGQYYTNKNIWVSGYVYTGQTVSSSITSISTLLNSITPAYETYSFGKLETDDYALYIMPDKVGLYTFSICCTSDPTRSYSFQWFWDYNTPRYVEFPNTQNTNNHFFIRYPRAMGVSNNGLGGQHNFAVNVSATTPLLTRPVYDTPTDQVLAYGPYSFLNKKYDIYPLTQNGFYSVTVYCSTDAYKSQSFSFYWNSSDPIIVNLVDSNSAFNNGYVSPGGFVGIKNNTNAATYKIFINDLSKFTGTSLFGAVIPMGPYAIGTEDVTGYDLPFTGLYIISAVCSDDINRSYSFPVYYDSDNLSRTDVSYSIEYVDTRYDAVNHRFNNHYYIRGNHIGVSNNGYGGTQHFTFYVSFSVSSISFLTNTVQKYENICTTGDYTIYTFGTTSASYGLYAFTIYCTDYNRANSFLWYWSGDTGRYVEFANTRDSHNHFYIRSPGIMGVSNNGLGDTHKFVTYVYKIT
jgi:hypothetical protein